jgi:acyl-coenzyme A thioesterase PaaI-like protein
MDRKVTGTQHVSRDCYVCGVETASGLHARFFELDGGDLLGVFTPRNDHQGYPGRLHGGVAATILDETIGRAIGMGDPEAFGVTVELTLRYRRPVPLDREVRALGRITKDGGRRFEGTGEIVLEDGTIAVEGTGRYLRKPASRIADSDLVEGRWFPDDRESPGVVDI